MRTSKTYNAWSSATYARLGSPVGNAASPLAETSAFFFSSMPAGVTIDAYTPIVMTLGDLSDSHHGTC